VSGWHQDGWRYLTQCQDATSIRRYFLIPDEHSDLPGVRRTGHTGRKVLFLLKWAAQIDQTWGIRWSMFDTQWRTQNAH